MDNFDYNICMKAVENINDDIDIPYSIRLDNSYVCIIDYVLEEEDWKCLHKCEYNNSMLLALQHSLLYIMENEK